MCNFIILLEAVARVTGAKLLCKTSWFNQCFFIVLNLTYFRSLFFSHPKGAIFADLDWFFLHYSLPQATFFGIKKRNFLWFLLSFLKFSRNRKLFSHLGQPEDFSPNLKNDFFKGFYLKKTLVRQSHLNNKQFRIDKDSLLAQNVFC